ncbi:MAG TPA: carboxypeptidase-like regulatory domain-containing protein [Candidatus Thermoplasmatota archaeon]|nr:carboxypeptidase-like regulatory domain-containing protein [Candidatus Thermoplasmatota archaeon]
MTTPPLRASCIAALFLLSLMAGCASKVPESSGVGAGRIDQTLVDATAAPSGGSGAAPGTPPKAGFGTIEGVIVDDANLTLAGAGVSLLGTQLFANSGKRGEFRFADLKPDVYGIRVQAPSFQVHEGKVTVAEGKVTKAVITMVPLDGRGPGYRPHLHDYWGRETTLTLMDDDVDLRVPTSENGNVDPNLYAADVTAEYPNENHTMYFHIPSDARADGRPALVLPATKEMRVTITWDQADVQVKQFGIGYTPASASRTTFYNMHPHVSGDPWVIPTQPKDTDNGHQYFTLWKFSIWTANKYSDLGFTPETIRGPIHVRIDLVKGEVPVDPPHADLWNGTTEMVVRGFGQETYFATACCTESNVRMALDQGALVPPGTHRMHLKFTWMFRPNNNNPVPPSPLDGEWSVSWKPASMDGNAHGTGDYLTAEPSKTGTQSKEWDIEVAPGDTDAFYQSASNWVFRAYQPSHESYPYAVGDFWHVFRLEVTVYKDPKFT